ncbi:MAG: TfoX/Sxy family protein [Acidobacteria bacterium]|nr:TfoX/Sxy family protein [Acidobacteriota bacterium]
MRNRAEYVEFIVEQCAPLGDIATRAMFGGHMLYCGGLPFALIADNVLYLKADAETRPRFEAAGLKAFQPYADRADTMSYYTPPPEFFEDRDVLLDWGRAAVAAAQRGASKKKPARRKGVQRG